MTMTRRKFLQRFAGVAAASFIAKQAVKPLPPKLAFHPDAFQFVWPMPVRYDVLYGVKVVRPDLMCRIVSA